MKYRFLSLIALCLMSSNIFAFEVYNTELNKLNIFGSMNALRYFSKNFYLNGDKSYINIGLKGETKITNSLKGYGNIEYSLPIKYDLFTNSFGKFNELSFVGLRFDNDSSLDYGRNYGVIYDINLWTNVLPEFKSNTYESDNFMFQRTKGLLTYRNKNFFGLINKLKFTVQYHFKNKNLNESSNYKYIFSQNGSGLGFSAIYNVDDRFKLGSAMFISHRTDNQNINTTNFISGKNNLAQAYVGGFKYDYNNIYLAATFVKSYNSIHFGSVDSTTYGFTNKTNNFELVTKYRLESGICPSLGYVQSRGNIQFWGKRNLKKFIDLGITYNFNKNISTYIDYQLNLIRKNNFILSSEINLNNVFAMGLVFLF